MKHPKNRLQYGVGIALFIPILFAITVTLAPVAYSFGASVELLLLARFLILLGSASLLCRKVKKQPLDSANIKFLMILSIAFTIQTFSYMTSVRYLPVSIAVVIFYTFPLFTYIIDSQLKSKKIDAISITLLLFGALGVVLIVSDNVDGDIHFVGILWGLLASVTQAVIITTSGYIQIENKWRIIKLSSILPVLVFLFFFMTGESDTSIMQLVWVIASGSSFCLGMFLFYNAISKLGAVRVANILYFEPVFVVMIAVAIFNDFLTSIQWIGILIVVVTTLYLEKTIRQK